MEQHFYIKWMRKEERIMRIAFLTLGCKVNSYETDKMKNKFIEAGDYIVSFEEEADIYLVNTCTVQILLTVNPDRCFIALRKKIHRH